jgi:peptide/nickel transport system substrate-binding protein
MTGLAALSMLAFAAAPTQAATSQVSGTLFYGQPAPPASLDPGRATVDNQTWKVLLNTYDALVQFKSGTDDIIPDLATSWTQTGNRVWTFNLRHGVKFQDGTTLNSQDVAYSIKRIQELGLPVDTITSQIASISTPSPLKVILTLKAPNSYFLNQLPAVYIVSEQTVAAHAVKGDMGAQWLGDNTAGSGPYKLVSWNHNSEMVLQAYPGYWQGWAGKHVKQVKILYVSDEATQIEMLQQGGLDMLAYAEPDLATQIKQDPRGYPGLSVVFGKSFETDYMAINMSKPPLNNVLVRQAIADCFPYQQFASKVTRGLGSVPRGPLPVGFPGADPNIPAGQLNLQQAKSLLAKAGYANGGFTLTYAYAAPQVSEQEAGLFLQSNLGTLGINVQLQPTPWAILVQEAGKGPQGPDLMAVEMPASNTDPIYFLSQLYSSSLAGQPFNWSYFKNPQVDKLMTEAYAAITPAARNQDLAQMQELIVKAVPAVYYSNPGKYEIVSTKVHGYTPFPLYYYLVDFYDLWMSH